MNFITAIYANFNEAEQAALATLVGELTPQWEAGDAETRAACELQLTEALNAFRSGQ